MFWLTPALFQQTSADLNQEWSGAQRGAVQSIVFSKNGKFFASTSPSGVSLWDAKSGAQVRSYPIVSGDYISPLVAFMPNGKSIASIEWGERTYFMVVRDVKSGVTQAKTKLALRPFSWLNSLSISPDGKRCLITGGTLYHFEVMEFDSATGAMTHNPVTFDDARSFVQHGFYLPDGKSFGADVDGEIRTWNADSGSLIRAITQAGVWMHHQLVLSSDGKSVGSLWETGPRSGDLPPIPSAYGKIEDSRLARVATAWDLGTGQRIGREGQFGATTPSNAQSLAFDEKKMIVAEPEHVVLWDLEAGKTLACLDKTVLSVAFAPDGRLVTGDREGKIQMWRVRP